MMKNKKLKLNGTKKNVRCICRFLLKIFMVPIFLFCAVADWSFNEDLKFSDSVKRQFKLLLAKRGK